MITLQPGNVHDPLYLDIGDDWFLEFDCTDATGAPLELAGSTIEWRLADVSGQQVLRFTFPNGGIRLIPGTPSSMCVVHVPATQTAGIAPGYYRDRLRVTTFEGLTTTQSIGRVVAVAT